MTHALAPTDSTVFDDVLAHAEEMVALTERVARYDKLLDQYCTSAEEFVDALDADELDYFMSAPCNELRLAVRRWLQYRATRPDADWLDRERQLHHAWQERWERAHRRKPTAPATLELRLRAQFAVRNGDLPLKPYDAPTVPLNVFLAWLTPEQVTWLSTIRDGNTFEQAVCSWLAIYYKWSCRPRLVGAPVPPMPSGTHQRFFVQSEHFDLHARRTCAEEGVDLGDDVPPALLLPTYRA